MRGMDKGGTLKGERTKSKNTSKYIFPSIKIDLCVCVYIYIYIYVKIKFHCRHHWKIPLVLDIN